MGLDLTAVEFYHLKFDAGVAKLVYALDSKSSGLNAHVGSTPTLGTTSLISEKKFWLLAKPLWHTVITGGDIMINNSTEVVLA
jgi:hypothetical protein